jgi:hypothetical protein
VPRNTRARRQTPPALRGMASCAVPPAQLAPPSATSLDASPTCLRQERRKVFALHSVAVLLRGPQQLHRPLGATHRRARVRMDSTRLSLPIAQKDSVARTKRGVANSTAQIGIATSPLDQEHPTPPCWFAPGPPAPRREICVPRGTSLPPDGDFPADLPPSLVWSTRFIPLPWAQ